LRRHFEEVAEEDAGLGWRSGSPWLEVLDLSTLRISDWRGVLPDGLIARLVILAAELKPQATSAGPGHVFGLVLDFDQRLLDAGRASRFLLAIQSHLQHGDRP
jgi:hypothetical protein